MQAIASLAAEDANRQIERHVIGMVARDADVPYADFGLHRIGLVDDDDAARRIRRLDEFFARHLARRPVAEHFSDRVERLLSRHVADNREDRVVRREILLMKRQQIVPRDPGHRRRRAAVGHPVPVEAVHEPVEYGISEVLGIVETDAKEGQLLLALPIDLLGGERRMFDHVGQHSEPGLEAVFHHDHVHVAEIARRTGAHRAADRIDGVVHLEGGLARSSLVEQRRHQVREAKLPFRVRRAAGADDHAHADGRLFVVEHRHHLQSVRQRLNLVGRELDVPRRQGTRRPFGWPVACLRLDGDVSETAPETQRTQNEDPF